MTEDEWLTCTDPEPMRALMRDRLSERKWRLFACACCHLVRHLMTDPRSWDAVQTAEKFADGHTTEAELNAAVEVANAVYLDMPDHVRRRAAGAAYRSSEFGGEYSLVRL